MQVRPSTESARLRALHSLALVDAPPEAELNRITRLAAEVLQLPICALSLVDADRLWFSSSCGLDISTYPRENSFCSQVVESCAPMVCPDLRADERFAEHPMVSGAHGAVRFYAGAPVRVDGEIIGSLCVLDLSPHPEFDAAACERLVRFATVIEDALLARRQRLQIQQERTLFADGPVAAVIWEVIGDKLSLTFRSDNLLQLLGPSRIEMLENGTSFEALVWRADLKQFRTALKSHILTCLPALDSVFRLDNGRTWLQQSSFGDYDADGRLLRIRAYLSNVTRQKHLESAIESAKERLHLALESASIGTWDMNLATRERVVNARAAAMLGYRQDEIDATQYGWTEMIHPYDRARVLAKIEANIAQYRTDTRGEKVFVMEYRLRHKAGHYVWVQSCGKVVIEADGKEPNRIVGTLIDVSYTKAAELERARNQQLLDLLNAIQRTFLLDRSLTAACDALFEPLLKLTDSQFGFIGIVDRAEDGALLLRVPTISNISWSAETRAWYEEQKNSAYGITFSRLDNLFGRVVTHDEVICTNDPSLHHASRGTPKGHPVLENFLGLPLRFNDTVVGMIGLGNRDEGFDEELVKLLTPLTITLGTLIHARSVEDRRLQAEAQLFSQATEDSLTGLANRRRFFDVATGAIAHSRRYDSPLTLAIMDLDHFKKINDTYGHAAGDAVLQAFADILRTCLRDTDLGARIGGEEFVLLMPSTNCDQAAIPLERIRIAVESHVVEADGQQIRMTVSLGVAQWHEGCESVDNWLAEADSALYQAKSAGRNRICIAETAGSNAANDVALAVGA